MQLTVLGCSPASTNPGGASSSYLVEDGQTRLLLDCGSGSFGRLIQYLDPATVDAIVISHMHADHTLDLIPYRYALSFAGGAPPKPALYLPPEGHAKLLGVSKLQDDSATFFSGNYSGLLRQQVSGRTGSPLRAWLSAAKMGWPCLRRVEM